MRRGVGLAVYTKVAGVKYMSHTEGGGRDTMGHLGGSQPHNQGLASGLLRSLGSARQSAGLLLRWDIALHQAPAALLLLLVCPVGLIVG